MTIPKVSQEAAEAFMDAIEPLLLARAESLGEQTPSKSWREHREKHPEMWERDWAIVLAGTEAALSVCESLIRSMVIDEAAGVADDHAQAWGLAMGSGAVEIAKAIRQLGERGR